jgi:FkbM family methyltransferase|tara:strand:+ start:201 stop:968 length:768 start_codon:yes stop_codon:yes gene_type:complete
MRNIINCLYKIRLLRRIVPSLFKVVVKIFKIKNIVAKHENFFLNLNPENPIDREIYLKCEYEKEQITFLKNEIKKNKISTFIDIGAHLGFYSINLSNTLKVYSFEPIKKNFDQLKSNILINNFDNIHIFNLALSNKKKKIEMWVSDIKRTGGFSVFNKNDEELKKYNLTYSELTQSDLADNMLDIKNSNIAIKIDVERHEEEVLLGASKLLTENKVIIQIEIFDERKKKVFDILQSYKYQLYNNIGKDYYFRNFI